MTDVSKNYRQLSSKDIASYRQLPSNIVYWEPSLNSGLCQTASLLDNNVNILTIFFAFVSYILFWEIPFE